MTRIIAVTNHKGGTVKTTSTVNIGAALAAQGRKVVIVDLDSQCNASRWLARGNTDGLPTSMDVLLENTPAADAVVTTDVANLDLIPAEEGLRDIGAAFTSNPGQYHVLASEVRTLTGYDYVLLDCPGDTGDMTTSALIACTEILVAVAAGTMELDAVVAIEKMIEKVCRRLNPGAHINHVLIGRVDRSQNVDRDIVAALREAFPDEFLVNWIPKNVKVTESYNSAQPVTVYAPRSSASLAYVDAARELDARGEGN